MLSEKMKLNQKSKCMPPRTKEEIIKDARSENKEMGFKEFTAFMQFVESRDYLNPNEFFRAEVTHTLEHCVTMVFSMACNDGFCKMTSKRRNIEKHYGRYKDLMDGSLARVAVGGEYAKKSSISSSSSSSTTTSSSSTTSSSATSLNESTSGTTTSTTSPLKKPKADVGPRPPWSMSPKCAKRINRYIKDTREFGHIRSLGKLFKVPGDEAVFTVKFSDLIKLASPLGVHLLRMCDMQPDYQVHVDLQMSMFSLRLGYLRCFSVLDTQNNVLQVYGAGAERFGN